jgi:glycosyltransferase involved in cell wall biosynthesis
MIHDIWLLSDRYKIPLDRVDKYCVLSDWHKEFARGHHKIPEEKLWITANGIDFERFDRPEVVARSKHQLIYSSSPDRGLETLLELLPRIREQVPDAGLSVLYGFDNWKKSAARKRDQGQLDRIARLEENLKAPGVEYYGRVGQDDLSCFFMESGIWAYPTDFEETFSITAIEAQRAHLPVVSSNYAGLRTTVGDSGILLGNGQKGQSFTPEYQQEFVDTCVKLMLEDQMWSEWSERGFKNTEKYSWENVAKGWQEQFRS